MTGKIKVLFICIHNSARSQMAEAYLNQLGKGIFEAESAGLTPGILNPLAVEVMREDGIDISNNETKSASDMASSGEKFDYIITVCDAGAAGGCPFFPGNAIRLHWEFDDPSGFTGSYEEKFEHTRRVRDAIKQKILEFVSSEGVKRR